MANQTEYWSKKRRLLQQAHDALPFEDYTQELIFLYERHMDIIDEVLLDLGPELDDDQYTETTSWQYEAELKELEAREALLEPLIEARIEKVRHEEFLRDIGMTQEQYDEHERQLAQQEKDARNARLTRLARTKK